MRREQAHRIGSSRHVPGHERDELRMALREALEFWKVVTQTSGFALTIFEKDYTGPRSRAAGRFFAKKDAMALLRWIYYAPDVSCLARKRASAEPFLTGDIRDFRHPKELGIRERSTQYPAAAAS